MPNTIGYQPVPSGNLPDGTAMTCENQRVPGLFERLPLPLGRMPNGDGLVARATQPVDAVAGPDPWPGVALGCALG